MPQAANLTLVSHIKSILVSFECRSRPIFKGFTFFCKTFLTLRVRLVFKLECNNLILVWSKFFYISYLQNLQSDVSCKTVFTMYFQIRRLFWMGRHELYVYCNEGAVSQIMLLGKTEVKKDDRSLDAWKIRIQFPQRINDTTDCSVKTQFMVRL